MNRPPWGAVQWTYTPRRKSKRKNLIIDAAEYFEVDVWIVEAGRHDLVQEKIDLYLRLIDTALLDDCEPMVLAIAWSLPRDFLDEIGPVATGATAR